MRLLSTRSIAIPRIHHRRSLIVAALLVQALVLVVGWIVMFQYIRGQLAYAVQDYIVHENASFVENLASQFPRDGSDPTQFGSPTWERWQRVIEEAGADLPAGGFACLLDDDGNILCHPDIRDDVGLRRVNLGKKLLEVASGTGGSVRIGDADPYATLSGRIQFVAEGTHYVATKRIADTSLQLLVHQPEAELFSAGRDITSAIVISGVVAAGIVLLLTGGGLLMLVRSYDSVFAEINQRLRSNLQIARDIQQATLPGKLPTVDGFDMAAWSQPADETGGDTYDVIGLVETDGHLRLTTDRADRAVVLLADAAGHGIGPALAVAELRAMLRASVRLGADLLNIAHQINQQLIADLPPGRFVTGWISVVNGASRTVESFSAGQGPLLWWRADHGEVHRLLPDQPPFGILEEFVAENKQKIELGPGDVLVAVSDGILEAFGPDGEQFGAVRAEEIVSRYASEPAESIASALREAVELFSQSGTPEDDRTAVVIKRIG